MKELIYMLYASSITALYILCGIKSVGWFCVGASIVLIIAIIID